MTSRLSVVIPVHDRSALLERALTSVTTQTYAPAEVIVVDDGSTDDSAAVAERFGATVIRQAAAGVSAARNSGLERADTPYVAFLDSDDEWEPQHLEVLASAPAGVSFASTAALTSDGALIGSQRRRAVRLNTVDRLLWPDNPVVTSAVMVHRRTAIDVGAFDRARRHSEDLDLWARLVERGPGVVLPQVTVRYRVHPGQASLDGASMRAGVEHLLARSSARTRRAAAIRDDWDDLRREGAGPLALTRFLSPTRTLAVTALLLHRARGRRIVRCLR